MGEKRRGERGIGRELRIERAEKTANRQRTRDSDSATHRIKRSPGTSYARAIAKSRRQSNNSNSNNP